MQSRTLEWYNTSSIFSIILLNALYYSEIGGEESIYRKVLLLNGAIFLLINGRFLKDLFYIFLLPILLVIASLIYNLQTITPGAINSTSYTILGYLLLSMHPIVINKRLMYTLITLGLIISLVLSIITLAQSQILELFIGFANFNLNQNQAGMFFFSCIAVCILFIKGWKRTVFIVPFFFLVITTGSRAAFGCAALLLIFSELFITKKGNIEVFKKSLINFALRFTVLGLIALSFIYFFYDYLKFLIERLTKVGFSTQGVKGGGRDEIWGMVFDLMNQSPSAWIFGFGPAGIDSMIGDKSTHSSYVDAIATKGLPFLIFALIGVFYLAWFHYKRDHLFVVSLILIILIFGYSVTDLFGGIGTLWGLTICLSLWTRSLARDELT